MGHERDRHGGTYVFISYASVDRARVMPLLALIMVGTLDLARAFFHYTRTTNAVKEGAIYACPVRKPQLTAGWRYAASR